MQEVMQEVMLKGKTELGQQTVSASAKEYNYDECSQRWHTDGLFCRPRGVTWKTS